ncbi:MAG TPA: hypothetical protein VE398_23530 [Acidobacteriota bacterium]|nr:hypothetical protein [Acidobacteriota bacterium]
MNRFTCLGLCALLAFASTSVAQSKPGIAGHWEGSINAPSQELKVIIDLDRDASGAWIGDIDIPDQMVRDLPLRNITVSDDSVSFELPVGAGEPKFKGKLSTDGTTLAGDFTQGGSTVPFSLKRTGDAKVFVLPKNQALPDKFAGRWEGTLDAMGGTLHLVFNLANKAGAAEGTIDSPDQGAVGIPMSEISADGDSIKITVRTVSGEYKGKLGEDGKVLSGEWSQGGSSMALVLKKSAPPKN